MRRRSRGWRSGSGGWRSRRGGTRARVRSRRRRIRRRRVSSGGRRPGRRPRSCCAGSARRVGSPGIPGAGRELKPEDQVDEIVDHYPDACRGCGHEFSEDERQPGRRFGRHQVAELPPISVMLVEHRTHRLGCRECGAKTTAELPAGVGGSAFGPNLQAALVTLTARNRISRRGMIELAATCSASVSRPVRSIGSVSAPRTRSPARTPSCMTGCSTRARCMSMRPAGEPRVTAARCGP